MNKHQQNIHLDTGICTCTGTQMDRQRHYGFLHNKKWPGHCYMGKGMLSTAKGNRVAQARVWWCAPFFPFSSPTWCALDLLLGMWTLIDFTTPRKSSKNHLLRIRLITSSLSLSLLATFQYFTRTSADTKRCGEKKMLNAPSKARKFCLYLTRAWCFGCAGCGCCG